MKGKEETALDRVYGARTAEELEAAYGDWAADYDRQTLALGYCLPFLIAAWVARYVPRGDRPILDAGCGTGLSGPCLRALGYSHIEGLDLSSPMLDVARSRNAYAALVEARLGEELSWPDGYFAAFFSAGVFTKGHAPADALGELVRVTRPGGHAIFTVRDSLVEDGGFQAEFDRLAGEGLWRNLETSPPFRAFAIDEPEVLVRAYAFEVL